MKYGIEEYNKHYYTGNHLSSTQLVTDGTGVAIQQVEYAPFGEVVNEYNSDWSSGQVPDFKFNAKELDEESGMYYFEARYQRPPVFISRDVMFEEKPFMSPYSYCRNNPLNMVDPSGNNEDWVEKANGEIYWDDNATSQETTKEGEKYLGKNVLVGTHNRDENLNEPLNSARFDLYLESNKDGPTATIYGNTVPYDVTKCGTLTEGLYSAEGTMYHGDWSLLLNGGGNLKPVNGNPNNPANYYADGSLKPISEHVMSSILFHKGNNNREALIDNKDNPYTTGCQTGGNYKGSHDVYRQMAKYFKGFRGTYYLRGQPQPVSISPTILPIIPLDLFIIKQDKTRVSP